MKKSYSESDVNGLAFQIPAHHTEHQPLPKLMSIEYFDDELPLLPASSPKKIANENSDPYHEPPTVSRSKCKHAYDLNLEDKSTQKNSPLKSAHITSFFLQSQNGDTVYLHKVIGSGSCSAVYESSFNGQAVACKVFDWTRKSVQLSYKNEIQVLKHISKNKDLQNVTATGIGYGEKIIVSQYHSKGALDDYLEKFHRQITLPMKIFFIRHIAQAINTLHQHGIIHRDLKRDNILLNDDGMPIITDFGLASCPGNQHHRYGASRYQSPKIQRMINCKALQFLNEPVKNSKSILETEYTAKDEMYNFSLLAGEILTGLSAYKQFMPINIRSNYVKFFDHVVIQHRRPPLPLTIPMDLYLLLLKGMQSDEARRPSFTSAIKILDHLKPSM